jgi:hypothetical protein
MLAPMEGPGKNATSDALEIEDPAGALEAAVGASCAIWDREGCIHEQLQAIVVLEAGAAVQNCNREVAIPGKMCNHLVSVDFDQAEGGIPWTASSVKW